jgi:general L-amino acid transport system substrate-binding protein
VALTALGAAACSSDDTSSDTTEPAVSETTEAGSDTTVVEVQEGTSRLDAVKAAGSVACGTRDALPGFAVLTDAGDHVGFDADFCRVIAAAVLGDARRRQLRRPRDC